MNRIYHPWWKWECYRAGFYNTVPPNGIDDDKAKQMYADFLSDLELFEAGLIRVLNEWPHPCEHFLSNTSINRIAWLGQSSMCLVNGIPAKYRGGYKLLSGEQQKSADSLADKYLKKWESNYVNNI